MLEPVVGMELRLAERRGRAHILRWLFATWLALQLLYYCTQYLELVDFAQKHARRFTSTGTLARSFVDFVLVQQFILIALVTPAFAAGAITDEKTRGTLSNLLTTDLTPAAVVLSKLCSRATQVIVLALVPMPLIALVGPLAGVTPQFLFAWLVVTTLLIVGLSAVSLLASVWTKQTRNAVLAAYVSVVGLWWVSAMGPEPVARHVPLGIRQALDPLWPLAPALDRFAPAEASRRLWAFTVVWGGLAGLCTLAAAWRLRPAFIRQGEGRRFGWLGLARVQPRPAVQSDALAWKEFCAGRRVPLWFSVTAVVIISVGATAAALESALFAAWSGARAAALTMLGLWALILLTLSVAVRASGSISGERERRTWDALLATTLPAYDIVHGKLNGILMSSWPYVLAYGLASPTTAFLLSSADPVLPLMVLAMGGSLTALILLHDFRAGVLTGVFLSLFIALAAGPDVVGVTVMVLFVTAIGMYYIGAVGLYCSARCQTSWRSLLATVAIGYAGVTALVGIAWLAGGTVGFLTWSAGAVLLTWMAAGILLSATERHIAETDRIKNSGILTDVTYRPLPHHRQTRRVRPRAEVWRL
jgi:ABC-type transport system involved in multi-copper enzyme maturation permease subunit